MAENPAQSPSEKWIEPVVAVLLSHATESVAAKIGDSVGASLNSPLGKSHRLGGRHRCAASGTIHLGQSLDRWRDRH